MLIKISLVVVTVLMALPALAAEPLLTSEVRDVPGVDAAVSIMRYQDAAATSVVVSGSWDVWTSTNYLTLDSDVWNFDVTPLKLPLGRYEYKFIVDGEWETGDNRYFYVNEEGQFEKPVDLILAATIDEPHLINVVFRERIPRKSDLKVSLIPDVPIAEVQLSSPDVDGSLQGYKSSQGLITFLFDEKKYGLDLSSRDKVTIAGNFNSWSTDGDHGRWQLRRSPKGRYWRLTTQMQGLRAPQGEKDLIFKFVINESRWLRPPEKAMNATDDGKGNVNLKIIRGSSGSSSMMIRTQDPIDLSKAYYVAIEGLGDRKALRSVSPGKVMHQFTSDKELGVILNREQESTTYRLFAPRASSVYLCFYDTPEYERYEPEYEKLKPAKRYLMWKDEADGVWELSVLGLDFGRYYSFNVDGPDGEGESFYAEAQLGDPYAKAAPHAEYNSMVINPEETNKWFGGWTDQDYRAPNWEDMVIYEAHVRDLTVHESSGVPPQYAGRYKGLILSEGTGTGLDYLEDLGVNMIEFLPICEFNNGDSNDYNWGYTTVYYFAPESSYGTEPLEGSQFYEFKYMVNELHKRGFGVIMDVVYNHVGHPNLFSLIDKKYFFRLNPDFSYSNFSGCGNDVRSEAPMMRRFIVENILYWIEEFHVDGFRFDLAELIDMETMMAIRTAVKEKYPDVILISEPWSFRGENKQQLKGTGWCAWNNDFRYAAKGFAMGEQNREWLMKNITGSTETWAANPLQPVNYLESHDDMALADEFCTRPDRDGRNLQANDVAANRLAATILFTSLGIPMIAEGQEFIRSKWGIHNTYNKGDDINALRWTDRERPLAREALAYYKGLVHMRNSDAGRAFRVRQKPPKGYYRWILPATGSALGYMVNANHIHDGASFVVLINANSVPVEFPVRFPDGKWQQIADGQNCDVAGLGHKRPFAGGYATKITIPPLQTAIFRDGF